MRALVALAVALVIGGIAAWSCVFIVDERQQALLLAFGRFERKVTEPGLHFKYPQPFNRVLYFEDRILYTPTGSAEIILKDTRRLVVEAFAQYRIKEPKTFYEAVKSETNGEARLKQILLDKVRKVLGEVASDQPLSDKRAGLMIRIRDLARSEADGIGVAIVDVRIKSVELPEDNLEKTYDRMKAERDQEAADERARGAEAARIRRAQADREKAEIVSRAKRDALIIKGKADAERALITAEAYGQDTEFFKFYLSLEAFRTTLTKETSSFVLTPSGSFAGDFFKVSTDVGAKKSGE
ncbi:MAG: protease modulator HflC [Neomegalonema sp.]|nr:protease modulator HflC [Neomegalonema sp.]